MDKKKRFKQNITYIKPQKPSKIIKKTHSMPKYSLENQRIFKNRIFQSKYNTIFKLELKNIIPFSKI